MAVYLIRHTTPDIIKGTCYGQTDIDITDSFSAEASIIKTYLQDNISAVYSSPLQRCKKLAVHLFPNNDIVLENDLMEIHCGAWEMRKWDDIPKEEIDPWMQDFVQVRIPGGESYIDLHQRVNDCFNRIIAANKSVAIITHGGVIRSILAGITQTPLKDSFGVFSLHYGCVVKIEQQQGGFSHTIFSTIPVEKEQHKPSRLKR
jgi:alpha-ribazole phosphatase